MKKASTKRASAINREKTGYSSHVRKAEEKRAKYLATVTSDLQCSTEFDKEIQVLSE